MRVRVRVSVRVRLRVRAKLRTRVKVTVRIRFRLGLGSGRVFCAASLLRYICASTPSIAATVSAPQTAPGMAVA